MSLVTIKQASEATGVSAKMIRHYESIGLISAPLRTDNRYRHYAEVELKDLRFIRHARDLGFSFEDIRQLLSLWRDKSRPSAEVKAIAQRHIGELEEKARQLTEMSHTLQALVACCPGNASPDCPILEALDPSMCCNS
jgi:MerR family copper efflux transcriptional regulator